MLVQLSRLPQMMNCLVQKLKIRLMRMSIWDWTPGPRPPVLNLQGAVLQTFPENETSRFTRTSSWA